MEDKKYMVISSSLHFVCSDIPDLAIRILKTLIPLGFSNVLQSEV